MDVEEETWKFKLMLGAVAVFLVSTLFAYVELKYAIGGKTAEGTVEGVRERIARSGRTIRTVDYRYRTADGEQRRGSADVGRNWVAPADDKLTVQYLDGTSRIAGQRNTGALILFFGSLAALLVGSFLFWRHVNQAVKPTPPRYR